MSSFDWTLLWIVCLIIVFWNVIVVMYTLKQMKIHEEMRKEDEND